jgi:hypothetical protein
MTAHAGLWETIKVAAPMLGLEAKAVSVRTGVDIEGAILAAAGEPDHGLVLLPHAIVESIGSRSLQQQRASGSRRFIRYGISRRPAG